MKPHPLVVHHARGGGELKPWEGGLAVPAYGDAAAEAAALRTAAGVIDVSYRGRLRLEGPDRTTFLHGQATADVRGLGVGDGVYSAFLTGKGKLRGDALVVAGGDWLDLLCDGTVAPVLRQHLAAFIIMDDVKIVDRAAATVEFALIGPEAESACVALGLTVPADRRRGLELTWQGVNVQLLRMTPLPAIHLVAPISDAAAVWERLAGALPPAGIAALETVRIEAGIARFGQDMDQDTIPIEAGLLPAIDYDKGCFTGYEVLARIRTYGHVNRHLVGVRLDGVDGPPAADALSRDGKVVGRLTSVTHSDRVGGWIGLAMVRREVAAVGTALELEAGRGTVVALPFGADVP